jgi:hypothetical protein
MSESKCKGKCDCGSDAERDIVAEQQTNSIYTHPGNWPMKSDAAGVHPDQIPEAYAKSVKDGVPTQFTKDGQAIFTSRGHRARYIKTIGMIDRDGGYSD